MAKPGPRSTPTNLVKLRGNPGKRKINKNEPKPKTKGVRCPEWMSPAAKNIWKRVAPELQTIGLLTIVDIDELARYCGYTAEYMDANAFIQKHGTVYPIYEPPTGEVDENGKAVRRIKYMQQYPQVAIARNAAQLASKIAANFGLHPSARVQFKMPDEKPFDEMAEFLDND